MKPLNLRANGGGNTKNNSWATMTFASAFRPTCNISSALAPLSRKNSLIRESAFFHTKIKNLSWNRWIYEQMVEKHQKLLLRNNAIGKCLHTHMQHFFRPSPAIEKKFAESAFFQTKIKTCQETVEFTSKWGKSTKNYSWATMPLASAFRPTCNISSALAPLSRKNSLNESSIFSYKNQKLVMKPLNLRANGEKTPKNTPAQQCPSQVPSGPHATFLQP